MEMRKISRRPSRSSDNAEVGHFTFFQKTAKKRREIYNARAQPLFCSLVWWLSRCRRRHGLLNLPNNVSGGRINHENKVKIRSLSKKSTIHFLEWFKEI